MSTHAKSGARAVADIEQGRILASVEIPAPAERVFRALTTIDATEWWGPADSYRATKWEGDARPGGRWRASGVGAGGAELSVEGVYLEVEAPRRIVKTWMAAWDGGRTTTVTYRLEPIEGGTRVTLRHEGLAGGTDSCREYADGWERAFCRLTKYLTPSEDRKTFMCRLLPPRATFMTDMTAEERGLMGEHVAYWKRMLDQGVAVVFGPVGGPAGGWGLGVLRAPSEEALHAMRDGDPIIKAKRGFSYEILPMLQAVTRD